MIGEYLNFTFTSNFHSGKGYYAPCTLFAGLRRYFSLIILENKLKNTFPANISRILRNQLDKSAIDIPFRCT